MEIKKLHITVGITGCGKSTWLKGRTPIVETDDIRKEILGDVSDISQEKMIFDTTRDRIVELFETNNDVYFGATNVDSDHRSNFLNSISELVLKNLGCNLEIRAVIFRSNIEVSRKRIQKDLDNGIDRANSLDLLELQYSQYVKTLKNIRKEKLFKFLHYV